MPVLLATENDIPFLLKLVNSAYRGEASKQGWTTEADLLQGELRTDEHDLRQMMQTAGGTFLKFVNEIGNIEGTVFLKKSADKMYLGMLSVAPHLQDKGIGKSLMQAAELYAREQDCSSIFMRVISVREELIAWYQRKGYRETGNTEPFPPGNQFGIPTRELEFLIMEKMLDS